MRFKSLGVGFFALCTCAFVFVYTYTGFSTNVEGPYSMDLSFRSWKIGQSKQYYENSPAPQGVETFITNTETSCKIVARLNYDPDDFPLVIDGPDWNVTMTHGFTFANADNTARYDKTASGNAHVPSRHPSNGRGNKPMSVTMKVTVTSGSDSDSDGAISKTIMKNVKQDTIDQIRQEYVDHSISVPSRSDFTSSSNYNSGDYGYAIDRNLAGRKSAWATACNVTSADMRLSSGYRNPEHNRHHIGSRLGALRGLHQYGRALDIYTIDLDNDGNIDEVDSNLMAEAAESTGAWTQTYSNNKHVHAQW